MVRLVDSLPSVQLELEPISVVSVETSLSQWLPVPGQLNPIKNGP